MAKTRSTVAVDLDGTLATYHGWQGREIIGDPRPGAVSFMWALYNYADIVVHTCRANDAWWIVDEWLRKHAFPPCTVWTGGGKPIATHYVDDRALQIPSNPGPDDYEAVLLTIRGVK